VVGSIARFSQSAGDTRARSARVTREDHIDPYVPWALRATRARRAALVENRRPGVQNEVVNRILTLRRAARPVFRFVRCASPAFGIPHASPLLQGRFMPLLHFGIANGNKESLSQGCSR
jgi:hypothetical protein